MSQRQRTILIVDDEEDVLDLLQLVFETSGFDVRRASTGKSAVSSAYEQPPDVVLLDVMMPEMDGLEVLRRIRSRFGVSQLPVIMASALGESRDLVDALRLGANDYVTKPLDMQVVLARVGTQLALRRASRT